MALEKFNSKYIPQIVERVKPIWTPQDASDDFKKLYAEAIVRQNGADNDMQFMHTDGGRLLAVTFSETKNETNSAGEWLKKVFENSTDKEKKILGVSRDYLSMMDQKTFSYMTDSDVKLSLFVSIAKGEGKKILDETIAFYKSRGFKNMYLWTDCDCNVDFYFNHGYELVEEGTYDAFSRPEEEYKTYVFKKGIF
ncbi:MAG: hypothetical protein KBT21_07780 [Treponema sp.]|nr:hypothetical protein [Candidatus Treponema merdequi]